LCSGSFYYSGYFVESAPPPIIQLGCPVYDANYDT
jgi:hypothetical protein